MLDLSPDFKAAVAREFPPDFLSVDPSDLATFGRDWTRVHEPKPSAVALPRTTEEVSSRRMARYDSTRRLVRYQFNRVAVARASALVSRGPEHGIRIATIATLTAEAEPEPGDPPAETLAVWDIAFREEADMLKGLPGERPTADPRRTQNLLRLARERRLAPLLRTDQIPACP